MVFNGDYKIFKGTSQSEELQMNGQHSTIYGGGGDDTIESYYSWYEDNVFLGEDGNDHISISESGKMYGDSGNDTLIAGDYDIFADGGTGNDSIIVKSPIIESKTNTVMTYGGKGSDIFIIQPQEAKVRANIMDLTTDDTIYIDTSSKKFTYKIEDGNMIFSDTDNTFELTFDDVSKASKLADVKVKYFMGTKTSTLGKLLGLASSGGGSLPTGLTYNDDKTEITASKKFKSSAINLTKYPKVKKLNASAVTKKLKITGNSLDNSIQGGTKNDTISGGTGVDTLDGGKGNDTLTGGNGNDVFIYNAGNDVITDYEEGDSIYIDGTSVNSWSFKGNNVIFKTGAGNLTVKNGRDKAITVTTTQVYSSSSALFAEDNFVTADNLSVIVENNLTATDYKLAANNFENLTQENNLITFAEK